MPFGDRDDVVQAFTSNLGIVLVARRAGSVSVDEDAKMTSTFMRASSATASCICSTVPDLRNSMTRFLPSTYPRSRKPREAPRPGSPQPRGCRTPGIRGAQLWPAVVRAPPGATRTTPHRHTRSTRDASRSASRFRRCQSHHDPSLSLCLPTLTLSGRRASIASARPAGA